MNKNATAAALPGDVLSVQAYSVPSAGGKGKKGAGRTFLLEVKNEGASKVLLASLPVLARLLVEKSAELRERRLEELIDFMTGQMLVPSAVDLEMAQRLAVRHARILNEFGYFTAAPFFRGVKDQRCSLPRRQSQREEHCDPSR